MLRKRQLMETVKFTVITKKVAIATTTDHATTVHEDCKFLKCATHQRQRDTLN